MIRRYGGHGCGMHLWWNVARAPLRPLDGLALSRGGNRMMERGKLAVRIVAIIMGVAAFAWGGEVVRQALQADDGGPPLGAICMAVPAFGLLVGAGAVWSSTNRK
jgi:hypothetical protein